MGPLLTGLCGWRLIWEQGSNIDCRFCPVPWKPSKYKQTSATTIGVVRKEIICKWRWSENKYIIEIVPVKFGKYFPVKQSTRARFLKKEWSYNIQENYKRRSSSEFGNIGFRGRRKSGEKGEETANSNIVREECFESKKITKLSVKSYFDFASLFLIKIVMYSPAVYISISCLNIREIRCESI